MPETCEHGTDWLTCDDCILADLALADALDEFAYAFMRDYRYAPLSDGVGW